jgi:hypothetical protein
MRHIRRFFSLEFFSRTMPGRESLSRWQIAGRKTEIHRGPILFFGLPTQDLVLRPKWESGNEFFGRPQELEKPWEKKHKVCLENVEAFRPN